MEKWHLMLIGTINGTYLYGFRRTPPHFPGQQKTRKALRCAGFCTSSFLLGTIFGGAGRRWQPIFSLSFQINKLDDLFQRIILW